MALTPFLRLNKPPFDSMPWDQAINGDMDIIDGAMAQFLSIANFAGAWINATNYTVGQVLLDPSNSTMWQCFVSHTSATYPTTFAQDRTAHPTYWINATNVPSDYAAQAKASADAADISEANALTYQNAAQVAATSATNTYNNFRNIYYGPSATAPTTDPSLNPPTLGDLYFSTSMNRMQEWTSAGWQDLTYNYMDRYLPFTGGTMFGPITLAADPTTNMQAATRQYVDNKIISSTGGVASFNGRIGVVTLNSSDVTTALTYTPVSSVSPAFSGNPTAPTPTMGDNDTSIATTAFVQQALGGVPGGAIISDTPPSVQPGALWWDSVGGQLYVRFDDGNSQQFVTTHNESTSQLYTDNAVASSQQNVGRNKIHNGLFNIAQRGAGPFTTATFTLDRWGSHLSGDTLSITQNVVNDASRAAIGDEACAYVMQLTLTGNAASGSYSSVSQAIEGVRRLAGKTIIVSFWATASAALKLGVNFIQDFGTGGSPSAGVWTQNGTPVTLSTSWSRYSVTFSVPSTAGKTLGTNGNDCTGLWFWLSSGATNSAPAGNIGVQSGTVYLWGVQLEIAQPGQTQPSPLEKRDPQQELALCQRFYCISSAYLGANGTAPNPFGVLAFFPVQMRAIPTIVFNTTSLNNCSGIATSQVQPGSVIVYALTTATGYSTLNTQLTASADL